MLFENFIDCALYLDYHVMQVDELVDVLVDRDVIFYDLWAAIDYNSLWGQDVLQLPHRDLDLLHGRLVDTELFDQLVNQSSRLPLLE